VPKGKTPEGPNGGSNDDGGDDNGDDGGDPGNDDPFGMHPMCCAACRHSISELYTSVDECLQAMEAMRQRMEDLERVVEDDYKFLNRNVRKLFGIVSSMVYLKILDCMHARKRGVESFEKRGKDVKRGEK
jgi:hypothetical protein